MKQSLAMNVQCPTKQFSHVLEHCFTRVYGSSIKHKQVTPLTQEWTFV